VFNKKLKKQDLIKNLSIKTGFSSNLSKKIINDLIELLIQNIKMGSLNLKNIGSFKIIYKKARIGRNPKTRKKFNINSRKSISFTASKKILEKLNEF
tara:strand:- start:48 stop:338 length:291 start_codon:yes stop_codon:yes gene_type:complete